MRGQPVTGSPRIRNNTRHILTTLTMIARAKALIIAVLVMTAATPGYSASSGELAVSAYITSSGYCWVNNVQNITFAPLDPLNPVNVQAAGRINVTCFGFSSNFTVGVTQVTPSPLLLTNGPNTIPYTLDLPTSASGPVYLLTSLSIPVTARIQGVNYRLAAAGTYTDTVTVQIDP